MVDCESPKLWEVKPRVRLDHRPQCVKNMESFHTGKATGFSRQSTVGLRCNAGSSTTQLSPPSTNAFHHLRLNTHTELRQHRPSAHAWPGWHS